jgi:hypothetical protein
VNPEAAHHEPEDGLRTVRGHLGWVQMEANVEGAEVVVNGVVVGTTPLSKPARVPAASSLIVVRARGYVPAEVRRNVGAGSLVRETVVLVAEPGQVTSVPQQRVASSGSGGGGEVDVDAGSLSSQRTWGYVLGGVGVAGLAATGVLAAMALSKTKDLPQACQDEPNHGCTPSQGDDIHAARGYAGIGNVTFGVGLVGVGVGTWLLLTAPSEPERAGSVHVLPTAGVGSGGVNIRCTF